MAPINKLGPKIPPEFPVPIVKVVPIIFKPHTSNKVVMTGGELIDSRLEEFPETPKDLMEKAHGEAIKYLLNCKIR